MPNLNVRRNCNIFRQFWFQFLQTCKEVVKGLAILIPARPVSLFTGSSVCFFPCPPAGAVTHSPPNQPGRRFFAFLCRLSTAPRLRTLPRRVQSFIGCPGLKWDARVLFQVYSRVNISLIRLFRTMDMTYLEPWIWLIHWFYVSLHKTRRELAFCSSPFL